MSGAPLHTFKRLAKTASNLYLHAGLDRVERAVAKGLVHKMA